MHNGMSSIARVVVLVAASALLAVPALAQYLPYSSVASAGFYPAGAYSVGQIESVNMVNGNVSLSIPLAKLPPGPGGFSTAVNLNYNSSIFKLFYTMVTLQIENAAQPETTTQPEEPLSVGQPRRRMELWLPVHVMVRDPVE